MGPRFSKHLLCVQPSHGGMEHCRRKVPFKFFTFFSQVSSNSRKEFQSPTLRLHGGSIVLLLKRFEQRGSSSCTWNSLHYLLCEKRWCPISKLLNLQCVYYILGKLPEVASLIEWCGVSSQRFWYFLLLVEGEIVTQFFWSFKGDEKYYEIINVEAQNMILPNDATG